MYREILTAVTGFGILQSLFFAIYFFLQKQSIKNKLLAFLLLAVTVRLSKSFVRYYLNYEHHLYGIGFIAFVALGPLSYFLIKAFLDSKFHWKPSYWWHFGIAIFLYSTCLILPLIDYQWWIWTYRSIIIIEILYTGLAFKLWYNNYQAVINELYSESKWLGILLLTILLVEWLYLLNGFGWQVYFQGAFLYAGFVSVIGFIALQNAKSRSHSQPNVNKYSNSSLSKADIKHYSNLIEQALQAEKLYQDANLKLPHLANHLNIPLYQLSQIINQEFGVNFSELINSYRIKEAQLRLCNSDDKILAIAYDCGFNSISAFNSAFKKTTGLTPSQFRKQ
ncbi:MAG: helix-turn-helix transcriptional regulator [Saprospiraceae bacterium]|nr:helix-turn-helix transcriptional regulator [Saprospiraceae bacterium]